MPMARGELARKDDAFQDLPDNGALSRVVRRLRALVDDMHTAAANQRATLDRLDHEKLSINALDSAGPAVPTDLPLLPQMEAELFRLEAALNDAVVLAERLRKLV